MRFFSIPNKTTILIYIKKSTIILFIDNNNNKMISNIPI